MAYDVYSFNDTSTSFSHPNVGSKSTTGAGIGSIAVSSSTTKTVHENSADGRIMISKVAGDNGTIAVTMQQTSDLHQWLLKNWYNYINGSGSSTDDWAAMAVTINDNNSNFTITATGVSPEKVADIPYQAQGQMVTWNLMAAEITRE
jgi:hypothetical protein